MPSPDRWRKAFVDLQNDVTAEDLRLAAREGFVSVELMKRYTTTGMGTDQGKLGNVNAIGILSEALSCSPDAVGTTTSRPPYTPLGFDAIRGPGAGGAGPARAAQRAERLDRGDWRADVRGGCALPPPELLSPPRGGPGDGG